MKASAFLKTSPLYDSVKQFPADHVITAADFAPVRSRAPFPPLPILKPAGLRVEWDIDSCCPTAGCGETLYAERPHWWQCGSCGLFVDERGHCFWAIEGDQPCPICAYEECKCEREYLNVDSDATLGLSR